MNDEEEDFDEEVKGDPEEGDPDDILDEDDIPLDEDDEDLEEDDDDLDSFHEVDEDDLDIEEDDWWDAADTTASRRRQGARHLRVPGAQLHGDHHELLRARAARGRRAL